MQAVLPGLNVTSIPLSGAVGPSPKGSLTPSVSYKLIKLDQTDADGHPKFMLAGQDANEPLLPVTEKSLKNRKVLHDIVPTMFGLQHSTDSCRTSVHPLGHKIFVQWDACLWCMPLASYLCSMAASHARPL